MNFKNIIIGFSLLASVGVKAQQERSLPVLSQGKDARIMAMGGTAYGKSTSSFLYSNPASAVFNDVKGSFSAYYQYQKLKGDTPFNLSAVGANGSYRFGNQSVMLGTRYYGGIKHTEISNSERTAETHTLYDQTIDAGYAIGFGKFAAFASASYVITSKVQTVSTIVASLGASYRDSISQSTDYQLTAKIGNIGASYKYISSGTDVQPPTFVGVGGEIGHTQGIHGVNGALSVEQYFLPSDASSTLIGVGAEYVYNKMAMLRLGYSHDTNGLSAFGCGVGVAYRKIRFDVSFTSPNNENVSGQLLASLGIIF